MRQLVDRTARRGPLIWDVLDDFGFLAGRITRSRAARHGKAFYAALGPDGCDLGFHPTVELATDAVVNDAAEGWPRSPRHPSERYRQLCDSPDLPVYPVRRGRS
jgi:hypothetical protein